MKISLLPIAALAFVLAPSVFAADLPASIPEPGTFAPVTATPVAAAHPAWDVKISVESKGLPLRAVLAAAFDSAKVPYAIDPGLDHTIYASVKDVTLREGIAILNKLAEFEVRSEKGVWYASRRKPKGATALANNNKPEAAPITGQISGPIDSQAILVDATPRKDEMVPMKVTPPASAVRKLPATTPEKIEGRIPWGTPLTTPAKTTKVGVKTARSTTRTSPTTSPEPTVKAETSTAKPALLRRVNTKLPKTDLRKVFETFSTQTGVSITVDESVPRYKIDSYMNGCSLKYALDRICEAAGLKYEAHGAAIRIIKA